MFIEPAITRLITDVDRQTLWMKLPLEDPPALEALLIPETALEKHLLGQSEFRHGLLWGEPRFGHPEGKVVLHIREVLDNIDQIPGISPSERQRLRLIALTHDTFKYAEDRSRPRDWNRHHGLLARRFLEPYTDDSAVLDIIETHDDAYYAWLTQKHPHLQSEIGHKSLDALLERVGHSIQLYYLFFKCDTQTGDKTQASLKWFERTVPGISVVPIREQTW